MFCPNCGAASQGNETFCVACGSNFVPQSEPDAFGFDQHNQQQQQRQQPPGVETRERRWAMSALGNGVLGIIFSIWTLSAVGGEWFSSTFLLIFILIDFTCSIPAIFNAIRGRSHNTVMFIAALTMGILSTVASLIALALWITM